MSERIWDQFLTDEDKEVFDAAGYGARGGFGERPAVLVIPVGRAAGNRACRRKACGSCCASTAMPGAAERRHHDQHAQHDGAADCPRARSGVEPVLAHHDNPLRPSKL